jgi:hypothetical protein
MTCGPFLGNELTNMLPRRNCFLKTNWLRNTVSRDTETEICNTWFLWQQGNCKTCWFLSRPRGSYKRVDSCIQEYKSRLEAGSNTSTVALRVVGGGEKGSLESWDSKIWPRLLWGSDPKMTGWWGPAAIVNDRPVLSSERAPQINKPANVRQK